jgi:fatty-acyl-CoA synthase
VGRRRHDLDTLDSLIDGERERRPGRRTRPPQPDRHPHVGTTGTPKGAPRNEAGIDAAISLLSRMPLKFGWKVHVAAPLFHTWGFAHMMLSLLLGHDDRAAPEVRPRRPASACRRAEV